MPWSAYADEGRPIRRRGKTAVLTAALRGTGFHIGRWAGEAELRKWEMRGYDRECGRTIPIRPDGYMELVWPDKSFVPFFIEVDMGTETNSRVRRKIGAYEDLRRETTRLDWRIANFYLLIVTSGARRMENLRRIAGKVLSQDFCFLATLEDLHPSRVLAAWHDVNEAGLHLIGCFEDESGGGESQQKDVDEEDDDDDNGAYYDDEDGETCYQVDKDEAGGDADDGRGTYYDDEDGETWPE